MRREVMEELRCKNCGGHINTATYTCEYCGTKYMRPRSNYPEDRLYIVELERPGIRVIGAKAMIPSDAVYAMGTEEASKLCIDMLAKEIASKLPPLMEISTNYNPATNQQEVNARLRVVNPSYRFSN